MSGNSKEAHNTLKTLTKTQQHKSADIEDSSGNILMESTAVLSRWTQYISGLYSFELLSSQTPTQETESLPVLRVNVEEAVQSLKASRNGKQFLSAD